MEKEFLNFFKEYNIQPQQIPQRVFEYIREKFPLEFPKIENHFYFLINFDVPKFRALIKKYLPNRRIECGLSSPFLNFIIIDCRLKFPLSIMVHELVELLTESHEEGSQHEILFAKREGIEEYLENFDYLPFYGKAKKDELKEIAKRKGITLEDPFKIKLRKRLKESLK